MSSVVQTVFVHTALYSHKYKGPFSFTLIIRPTPVPVCVDCNKVLPSGCRVHNTDYVYQSDAPVLSRARATLPPCFTLQRTATAFQPEMPGKADQK